MKRLMNVDVLLIAVIVSTIHPSPSAYRALLGQSFGGLLNIITKLLTYFTGLTLVFFAIIYFIFGKYKLRRSPTFVGAVWLIIILTSTLVNDRFMSYRIYFEQIIPIICCLFLSARYCANLDLFKRVVRYLSRYLLLLATVNSITIFYYYPNGLYVSGLGSVGNANYYFLDLDNVGFIICLTALIFFVLDLYLCGKSMGYVVIFVPILSAYFYSRAATAIIVSILLAVSIFIVRNNRLSKVVISLTFVVSVLVTAMVVSSKIISQFGPVLDLLGKDALLGGRYRIWSAALSVWKENLFFGIGMDAQLASNYLFDAGFVTTGWGESVGHAHNVALEILLKSGLTGFCCFCWFVFKIFQGLRGCANSYHVSVVVIVLFAYYCTALLDYRILMFSNWLILLLLASSGTFLQKHRL